MVLIIIIKDRLLFGINIAAEIYQKWIMKICIDVENDNVFDDILIFGDIQSVLMYKILHWNKF